MEITRMPRSQLLNLTMENDKKKKEYRVNAAPRKLIQYKYKCNQKSPVCFVLKI